MEKTGNIFKNKKMVMIICGILAAVVVVGGVALKANAAMCVESYTVDKGEIGSVVEINGKVQSNKSHVYYAVADGRIGTVHVKPGDFVKKGDLLISYDQDDLDRLIAMAEFAATAEEESYNNSMQAGNRVAGVYSQAKKSIAELDQQIMATQMAITNTQNALLDKKKALAQEGANLQISIIEWSDEPNSDEYENLHKLAQTNQYELNYGSEVTRMQEELNALNAMLASLKEYRAEAVGRRSATELNLMTDGSKAQLEAVKASNELSSEDRLANYAKAKDGIKAEFNGVVTSVDAVEGMSVAPGVQLLSLDSSDDYVIRLDVNKYDIVNIEEGQSASMNIKNKTYTGKVSRIEKMVGADATSSGIGVEVTFDEPDDDIILGLETKAKISTASESDVIRIPIDALSADEDGEYVFVMNDGKATKMFVESGIKNDDMAEIRTGLSEGDVVIWNDSAEITDGMSVKLD